MGIYARDQIQYANMLQNALQNRARAIEREGDNIRGRGQMWGSAVSNIGNTIKDAAFSIASQKHADEQAQLQRDFSAEQAALRAKEAMERQAAQEQFQTQQNALNRQSTEGIAALNRQTQQESLASEKQARAIMNIEIQDSILGQVTDEIMRTDDKAKLADLYRKRDEALAKKKFYAQDLSPELLNGKYSDAFAGYGFKPGMGKSVQTETVPVTPVPSTSQQNVSLAGLTADLANVKNSRDAIRIQEELGKIDENYLSTEEKKLKAKTESDLAARITSLKKSEAALAKIKNWKPGDEIPEGYKVKFEGNVPVGLVKK